MDSIIGIDPGASGGIALWAGGKASAMNMPKDMEDIRDWLEYVKESHDPIVFIEKLSVRPDDVSVSDGKPNMGKMYRIQKMIAQYEQLKATIMMCDIPMVAVHPMKWQNALHLRKKGEEKADRKRRYRDLAAGMYPEAKATLLTGDALLIMHFGRWAVVNDSKWVSENMAGNRRNGLFGGIERKIK